MQAVHSRFCCKTTLKETGEFIAIAGMKLSNDRFIMGEFYYKLFPEYWGKGLATEMAKALIKFGFENAFSIALKPEFPLKTKHPFMFLKKPK